MTLIDRVKSALLATQRHSWEQGVAAQALLELGDADLVVQLAGEAVTRQTEDGRLGVVGENHAVTDPAALGEAVLFAARATGDERLSRAAKRMLDYLLHRAPRTPDGTWHHLDTAPQLWIDSLYMGPPFVALAGRPHEAIRQVEGLRAALWNADRQLFSHIWDQRTGGCVRAAC